VSDGISRAYIKHRQGKGAESSGGRDWATRQLSDKRGQNAAIPSLNVGRVRPHELPSWQVKFAAHAKTMKLEWSRAKLEFSAQPEGAARRPSGFSVLTIANWHEEFLRP